MLFKLLFFLHYRIWWKNVWFESDGARSALRFLGQLITTCCITYNIKHKWQIVGCCQLFYYHHWVIESLSHAPVIYILIWRFEQPVLHVHAPIMKLKMRDVLILCKRENNSWEDQSPPTTELVVLWCHQGTVAQTKLCYGHRLKWCRLAFVVNAQSIVVNMIVMNSWDNASLLL